RRVEDLDAKVLDDPTLARQTPALASLPGTERIRLGVFWRAANAAHQTGLATAGTTAVGDRTTTGEQTVEQVAAQRHPEALPAHLQLRHRRHPRPLRNGCGRCP